MTMLAKEVWLAGKPLNFPAVLAVKIPSLEDFSSPMRYRERENNFWTG